MLTFEPDDYINEIYESHPRWIVTLSDGRKVYQDDGRPGTQTSSWLRLRTFLDKNPEISIVSMTISFRDNILDVGNDAEGYFFVKSVLGSPNLSQRPTIEMWVVGTYNNGELRTKRYTVPEMILVEEEIRDPLKAGECLICPQSVMNRILTNHQQHQTCIVQPLSILPS